MIVFDARIKDSTPQYEKSDRKSGKEVAVMMDGPHSGFQKIGSGFSLINLVSTTDD